MSAENFNLEYFLLCWLIAGVIAVGTAIAIGQERKLKWFKQRSKNGLFVRRGALGNYCMLGMPVTVPGFPHHGRHFRGRVAPLGGPRLPRPRVDGHLTYGRPFGYST